MGIPWLDFTIFLFASLTREMQRLIKGLKEIHCFASKEHLLDAKAAPADVLVWIICHSRYLCWSSGPLEQVGTVLNQGQP